MRHLPKFFFATLSTLCLVGGAKLQAFELTGRTVDSQGAPVPHVRIRVATPETVPYSSSVFSDASGRFTLSGLSTEPKEDEINFFRIGWNPTGHKIDRSPDAANYEVKLERIDNVAHQIPPSAWLGGDKSSEQYALSNLQCSNCHQLAAKRVRAFASKLAALPASDRAEAWLERAATDLAYDGQDKPWADGGEKTDHPRVEAWENMVQYMRFVTLRLGENQELRWGLEEGSPFYDALLSPETSLFSPADMAVIVPNLALNFPGNFDTFVGYDDVVELGNYGVSTDTRIDEFVLPTFGWTRELAIAPGSDLVWFIETDKDRLGGLNPNDGSVIWFDVPGDGPQGPHTMNADAQGNLWIALENSFHIARFNTKSRQWRTYPPPANTDFGVTHDFAYNSDRHVETDANGRIWITDMGKNELWALNVETGEIEKFGQPLSPGESHFHSLLYGAAIETSKDRVWWAQLYGYVGAVDTTTDRTDRIIPFEKGAGPRRLAIGDDGILWVPLNGKAQLARVNTDTGVVEARYQIPDQGSTPYGVTVDKKRKAVWAATSNSDRVYRFDIETEQWSHYPLPRQESFIRMIELDPVTGDLWTTYSSLPVGRRDAETDGTESANNMLVRIRPGD
ncbi:MAG: streptogramin lyase [Halioglobus sp.]|jgi:streptogramin lyase